MRLYELTAEYQQLADALISDDGEISPAAEAALDSLLSGMIADNVDGACCLYQQLIADSEEAKNEAKRLNGLAKLREAAAERIKLNLKTNLEILRMPKFETAKFRLRLQANSRPSITWTKADDEMPMELTRTRVEFNSDLAYKLWKEGVPLPEGVKVEQGRHLRIS